MASDSKGDEMFADILGQLLLGRVRMGDWQSE